MYKSPYEITTSIYDTSIKIAELIGKLEGLNLCYPQPQLRKDNQIKTIHNSLAIEGNTLSESQITAMLEGKRVIAPVKDMTEVKNAIKVYGHLHQCKWSSITSFKKMHKVLMHTLTDDAGQWRNHNVGIIGGNKVHHIAPPKNKVPELMDNLFKFLRKDVEIPMLIKACIFHYELEFIHPFSDGNGRMGRLWQQVIAMNHHPLLAYICVESFIKQKQVEYYNVLSTCDQTGSSTLFIEFSLNSILEAVKTLYDVSSYQLNTADERLLYAKNQLKNKRLSRKKYLTIIKNISTATASRDLAFGVKNKILKKIGDKGTTVYEFLK
jgi:cell filamentation protein, protein adenylyltransferase